MPALRSPCGPFGRGICGKPAKPQHRRHHVWWRRSAGRFGRRSWHFRRSAIWR